MVERLVRTESGFALVEIESGTVCGMCGKPLDGCHSGPCPWGVPATPKMMGEPINDWLECPKSTGQVGHCGACRYGYNDTNLCTQQEDLPPLLRNDWSVIGLA